MFYGYGFIDYLDKVTFTYIKAPDSHRGAVGDGHGARLVGALLAGLAARLFVRSLYSLRSLELPATPVGEWRRRHSLRRHKAGPGPQFYSLSFKPKRAFNVIAHVRDWEHAETVRRRCLRTVRGFALHAECTGPGRHVGESAPGPTGLMWASELSEPRHAQAERPPSGREHERACANVKRRLGANPRTGFRQVPLTTWLDTGTRVTPLVLGWV